VRRGPTLLGTLLALAIVGWCAGFAWFLRATEAGPDLPPRADGIVALTGGAGRVEAGLRLLASGIAPRLLVSGVGGSVDFAALARRAGADPALGARVTLGRAAGTTRGNAAETAAWARANGVRSLVVVTAGYHMPRALAELARAMPAVALHPAPVGGGGVVRASRLRLLAEEYTKWLAVESGLAWLALGPPEQLTTRAFDPAEGGG
jgi:uncharacterized SAM-binding protein YcdF (DUF218 family)